MEIVALYELSSKLITPFLPIYSQLQGFLNVFFIIIIIIIIILLLSPNLVIRPLRLLHEDFPTGQQGGWRILIVVVVAVVGFH